MSQQEVDDITKRDVEAAFRVLEYVRDQWSYDERTRKVPNEAHCVLQEFVDDVDINTNAGTRSHSTDIEIGAAPQEAIDYAFDQFDANHLWELFNGHRDFPLSGEFTLDYENNSVRISGLTIVEQVLLDTIDEKLAGMITEVEHGERDDFSTSELRQARRDIYLEIRRASNPVNSSGAVGESA